MAAPNSFEQERQRFERAYNNNPAANKNDGYFKQYQPWKASPPATPAPLPTTANTPNPLSAAQNPMPPPPGGSLTPPARIMGGGNGAQAVAGIAQVILPGLVQQGPNYLNPTNPKGLFGEPQIVRDIREQAERQAKLPPGFNYGPSGKPTPNPFWPDFWNPLNPISPFNGRSPLNPFVKTKDLRPGDNFFPDADPNDPSLHEMGLNPTAVRPPVANEVGTPPKNSFLPPWLNPFKDTSKTGESLPNPSDRPNAESKGWFPNATRIKIWSTNGGVYLEELVVLDYQVTALPIRGTGADATARYPGHTYLRPGNDDYVFSFTQIRRVYNDYVIEKGTFDCEPWTLENLGPDPSNFPNPNPPENRIPETGQPFFPPLPGYLDDVARPQPPTILDPNDFRAPSAKKPLSPMFPPALAPIPKPLDPLQTPETPIVPGTQPPKPTEEERKVPPLPFNPLPAPPSPIQNPPSFEPGPVNPNQRLNDRGIFPSRQADKTATVSGSPLSPDIEIGGAPVTLSPPPTITKPKPPFETDAETKQNEAVNNPFPLPLVPPVFPRPTGPTGTIDPVTADDINKSKNPPPPPVGTKPKCQDKCMAGLETGQQSILDKLNGNGLNVGLNAAELGLLTTINAKMGAQLVGGLAGKLGRLSEWLHLDRALNLMTFATTLHNAYFLSSGLTQTLFSMISNVLAAGGIKDDEKNPLDIGAILGKQTEAYAKSVLGVATVDGIKAEWKKYSRIYQAASNLLFSLQSIGQSILGALEMVGSMVAKIGNALQKFGVISEKAFGWMNQSPNYQNRFFTTIEKVEEVTSNIDSIAGEVLSVQDTITQIGTQKKELEDATKQTEGSKQGKEAPEAATVKAMQDKAKTDSKPPTIPVTAESKPEA
jgi:hypothetical protein